MSTQRSNKFWLGVVALSGILALSGTGLAAPGSDPVLVAVAPPVVAAPTPASPALALAALDRKIADLDADQ